MSEWKEMNIAHKQVRDDMSVEPIVRLGKKPKKNKPWAVCSIHPWNPNNIYLDYYARESDARKVLSRKDTIWKAWLEYEGEKVETPTS